MQVSGEENSLPFLLEKAAPTSSFGAGVELGSSPVSVGRTLVTDLTSLSLSKRENLCVFVYSALYLMSPDNAHYHHENYYSQPSKEPATVG